LETGEFIVGFIAGIGTNLLSWWVLAHYFIPNINFGPSISKFSTECSEDDKSGYRYRIKLANSGRRQIIDINLSATIRVDGLRFGTTTEIINIPFSSDGEKDARILYMKPIKPNERNAKILRLHINAYKAFSTGWYFPEDFRNKAKNRMLTLEDVMSLGANSWLQLTAFGYDEFSGARKMFTSRNYTIKDIKYGKFRIGGLDVVELERDQNNIKENGTV